MKYFLVVQDDTRVISVTEYANNHDADKAHAGLQDGQEGVVYSADSRETLGINPGDLRPADLSDDMDFEGFSD